MKKTFIKIIGSIFLIIIICQQVANATSIPQLHTNINTNDRSIIIANNVSQLLISISTIVYFIFETILFIMLATESIKKIENKEHNIIELIIIVAGIIYLLAIIINQLAVENVFIAILALLLIIAAIISRIIDNNVLSTIVDSLFIYLPMIFVLLGFAELILMPFF